MIDNLTYSVTSKCNSRCTMCNQWQYDGKKDMTVEEIASLFGRGEFSDVHYLNITGGEPFLRSDIGDVVRVLIDRMRKLEVFFISTNGARPEKTQSFVSDLVEQNDDLDINVTVSIDGDRNLNKLVRGVDSFYSGLRTIELCRSVSDRVKTMISTTLTPVNCSHNNLSYLRGLAADTKSDFSFRMGAVGEYYCNEGMDLRFLDSQIKEVISFIRANCLDNPFLVAQADFLTTGEMALMGGVRDLKCAAGDTFVFIDSNGDILPCINSTRRIGDKDGGITVFGIADLGVQEDCVCCTECTFYPMYYKDL